MKRKTKKKVIRYSIYFILFSFLGSILEGLYGLILNGEALYYCRTCLLITGIKIPFIPFYGLLGILLVTIQKYFNKKKVPVCAWGLLNAIIIIAYEFIFGLLGLLTFNKLIWDYTSHAINFMGIISLNMSLLWLIAGYSFSLIYLFMIKPLNN